MNLFFWLKPGIGIKRWIMTVLTGTLSIFFAIHMIINRLYGNMTYETIYIVLLTAVGIFLTALGISKVINRLINILVYTDYSRPLVNNRFIDKIYDKNILSKGIKAVIIGGGTGLSVLLRGLKNYTSNITAIVTVADDGGGSGKLREDLGMLPPGDIRNCILALANTEPIMEKLLQYRFKEGVLKGQSFGNLLIAAMVGISSNFEEAIKRINDIFAVRGKVLPVTTEDITLYAKLSNEQIIKGESQIPIKTLELNSKIEKVFIKPRKVKPLYECIEAIMDADVIILGPGSLYTSIMPNLLVEDISKAIEKSPAMKVYVGNLMTQPGETDGYTIGDHVKAIYDHTNREIIEYVYVNSEKIPDEILAKYYGEGAVPVELQKEDRIYFSDRNIKVIKDNFIEIKKGYIRHNAVKLSEKIIQRVIDERYGSDRIKYMELNSIMKRIRNNFAKEQNLRFK